MYIRPDEEATITAWAQGIPSVRRCWVFGSRNGSQFRRKMPRLESDLDIGIEIDLSDQALVEKHVRGYDHPEPWHLWFAMHMPWEGELQELLPYKVDLKLIEPIGGAEILGSAARLLYTRAGK